MSLPEISRRCRSCGAAVRAGARFCPHCGQAMSDSAAPVESSRGDASRDSSTPEAPAAKGESSSIAQREPEPQRGSERAPATKPAPTTKDVFVASSEPRPPLKDSTQPAPDVPTAPSHDVKSAPPRGAISSASKGDGAAADAAAEERQGRVARVREGTRARGENTRARVERVREDALVALEETPDDSGLRFVFVAVFLFALFLLFLLLSTTVLR